ncbi:UvrD-helicase domain-containing protein [Marinobacter subterrani]|uniref:UvrD-helicase domain-containing protein n=1 Tax=Marinobacter subterrani TaxID=1658765 RepID=UPI0023577B0A|nr:UvrD-helicase domain-containing protein [Marinobacter subterrani]
MTNRLKLTSEQRSIIGASRHNMGTLTINAFAGTGKTMTLTGIALADKAPGVYIVYNQQMKREAQRRFPEHIIPLTGHALAFRSVIANSYGYEQKFKAARDGKQIPLSRVSRFIDGDQVLLLPLTNQQMASLVLETVKQFQYSADPTLESAHVPIEQVPAKLRAHSDEATLAGLRESVTHCARKLWSAMANENDDTPILHDTYLKLLQLREPDVGAPRWLCDEFQDANPVLDALIRQQSGQKIYVGDPYQAIYGWRKAVNALEEINSQPGVQKFTLSHSFRFGGKVAGLANRILRSLGETTPLVGAGQPLVRATPQKPLTVIARNNLTLLDEVLTASEDNRPFCLLGNAGEMASMVRSAYALFCGANEHIKHSHLKGYGNWDELKETARLADDEVLNRLVTVIERFKGHALHLADHILANKDNREHEVNLVLTTAHRAKGREWAQVKLHDDLALPAQVIKKLQLGQALTDRQRESVNLLYVALTRTQTSLVLPEAIRDNLKKLRYTELKTPALALDAMNMDEDDQTQPQATPTPTV